MSYIENPKTKGSGILCAIPQTGRCPVGCSDCFFQGGRSYLEPLSENLPNLPSIGQAEGRVVRINDGNDSNVDRETVIDAAERYRHRFFNTSIPRLDFPGPVVLTLNPGKMTDEEWHRIKFPPRNLMFVRLRTNTWNLKKVVEPAVTFYTDREVPVVLTWMAYYHNHASMPELHKNYYAYRRRTQNSYWAIRTQAWREAMCRFEDNPLVHSCGKIEGEKGSTACKNCGNCLREFFAAEARLGVQLPEGE